MGRETRETQVSAGGVAFRHQGDQIEVALISVGLENRWQIPKGLVEEGEEPETAAQREVREETGLSAELLEPIETVDYWFYANRSRGRVRYHKYVHFYLLRYLYGEVTDHDHEVNEARWVEINEALRLLTYENEQRVMAKARERILVLDNQG